jgi:hypothetical protein
MDLVNTVAHTGITVCDLEASEYLRPAVIRMGSQWVNGTDKDPDSILSRIGMPPGAFIARCSRAALPANSNPLRRQLCRYGLPCGRNISL